MSQEQVDMLVYLNENKKELKMQNYFVSAKGVENTLLYTHSIVSCPKLGQGY